MSSITFPGFGPGHAYAKSMTPAPVVAGTGILETVGGSLIATDNGFGAWVGSGVSAATIDYTTGATNFTLATDYTSVNLKITWTTFVVLPVARTQQPAGSGLILNQTFNVGTVNQSNPYGVDIKCFDDLDPYFSLVGGIFALSQDLYHRLMCAPGSVPGAPNFGFDSRMLLNQAISEDELRSIQSNMTTQLCADERVQAASVTLSFSNGTLTVTANVMPLNPQNSPQPFQFVAAITSIGAQLLSVSPVLA